MADSSHSSSSDADVSDRTADMEDAGAIGGEHVTASPAGAAAHSDPASGLVENPQKTRAAGVGGSAAGLVKGKPGEMVIEYWNGSERALLGEEPAGGKFWDPIFDKKWPDFRSHFRQKNARFSAPFSAAASAKNGPIVGPSFCKK